MNKNKSLKKIAAYYDERAKRTDSVKAAGQWGSRELVPEICTEICNKIKIKRQDKVLEVGCGSGVLGNVVKDLCTLYVGIDISNVMLEKFVQDSNNEKINLFQSITSAIPFKNNFFEIIIMNGVTMYLNHQELEKTLSEIKRISSKNAAIFIGDNVTPTGFYWELLWFQNLNINKQKIIKPYIRFRKWLTKKNSKLAGKWINLHEEVSPDFIKKYFENVGETFVSKSATTKVKEKKLERAETNKRVDFVIKLGKQKKHVHI